MKNNAENRVLLKMQEWEQQTGSLPQFVQYYRELLKIQTEAKDSISIMNSSVAVDTRGRISIGIPLLKFEEFLLDWQQVKIVFERILAWVATREPTTSNEKQFSITLPVDIRLLKQVSRKWYLGQPLTNIPGIWSFDNVLNFQIIGATLKPFLSAYAAILLPAVNQELWRRKYCPICGGSPDFAYLDRENGSRWLFCSRCDSSWLFLRLECPFCGNENQDKLSYYTDNNSKLYRFYACEQCHSYLKAVDLKYVDSDFLLPLERLLTLDIDKQAQQAGYKPHPRRTLWEHYI